MNDDIVLYNLVSEELKRFKENGNEKIAYNYSYPLVFDFAQNTDGQSIINKITVSGSQEFIFNKIYFSADGDFDLVLKDVATGRVLSEQAVNSQVLSDVNFVGQNYRGIHKLDIPKIVSGNGELNIIVYNRNGNNANTVKFNFKGVSINSR